MIYLLFCFINLSSSGESQSGLSINYENETGIGFSYSFPLPTIEQIDEFHRINFFAPNSYTRLVFGEPELPFIQTLVGIPAEGQISLSVEPSEPIVHHQIRLMPIISYESDKSSFELGEIYQRDEFFPQKLAEIDEIGIFRDVRCAKILLSPFQYNPIKRELRFYKKLRVEIRFEKRPDNLQSRFAANSQDYFDNLYERVFINGKISKFWKITPFTKGGDERGFFDFSSNWLKIKIESTGVYRITYEDLKKQGINLRLINPKTFQLYNIGDYRTNDYYPDSMVEIPIYVYGEDDSTFDAQDYILFFGKELSRNLYTKYNIYWLTWGNFLKPGKRITRSLVDTLSLDVKTDRAALFLHLEEDNLCPSRAGLFWLWTLLTKPETDTLATWELPIDFPNLDTIERIRLRLYQNEPNYNNRLRIYFNSTLLETLTFRHHPYENPLDVELTGLPPIDSWKNLLSLQLFGNGSQQVYIDYLAIFLKQKLVLGKRDLAFFLPERGIYNLTIKNTGAQPIIFDVTNRYLPKMLVGFKRAGDTLSWTMRILDTTHFYVTDLSLVRSPINIERRSPGRLRNLASGAVTHYFVITPEAFYRAALLLARYRQNNIPGIPNGQAKAVKLEEIYDDFSFGIEEPGAIKKFLRLTRPYYVLLIGDGTYDYRNNFRLTKPPGVPPFEKGYGFDPRGYDYIAFATDAWYADLDGPGSIPDIMMGRITARSKDEVVRFYKKLVSYEKRPFGFWNKRFIFLADDEWQMEGRRDPIGFNHIIQNEGISSFCGKLLEPVKVYLTEYPFVTINDKPEARARLIDELNRGALLFTYFGHGAAEQLSDEQVLRISDLPKINNGLKMPFGFLGTCAAGRFDDTRFESIGEELTRKADGFIANISATKATSSQGNFSLAQLLFIALITQAESSIGRAFLGVWNMEIRYHLFGDPATRLLLPDSVIEGEIEPDTFKPGRLITIKAENSDSLPIKDGYFSITVFGPTLERYYRSPVGSITYILPGRELFRGLGEIKDYQLRASFIIPLPTEQETRYLSNGWYIKRARTSKVSLLIWNSHKCWTFLRDTIPDDTVPVYSQDKTGPKITLYHNQRILHNGDFVPNRFILTGRIEDESGILLAKIPGFYLRLTLKKSQEIGLADYFVYENNSYTRGRFAYPLMISQTEDTISVFAADNFLNLNIVKLAVRTNSLEILKIENGLVTPNPVKSRCYFTFNLTKPANVELKIYTIKGRLIRTIKEDFRESGYNQIAWDGLDANGAKLENGIYLYRIFARQSNEQTSYEDKFLILH